MKLKHLLLAALAVTSVGSVHAQEAGTYYIQNVETGKWLGPGNSWGTQASVLDHADYWKLAKVSDGVYTLESVVTNGGSNYYLSGTYCDGGATNLYFTAIDGKDNTYSISTADGSAYITANTDNSIVVNDAKDANSGLAQWKLYSESDMAALLATASAAKPIDATYLIKDHDLGRNNRDYSAWSNTGATAPKSSANNAATTIYSVEAYKTAFDVNQTVSNLPKGTYAVYINGMFRQEESTSDYPYVYANDTKVTFPIVTNGENNMQAAAVSFVAGNYLSAPAYVTIEEGGSIKIGAKTVGNKCWSIFKSFHLYYYGDCTVAEAMGENADLSKLIVNNSFENGSAVGWVNTGISAFINGNDNIGGKDGKYYIEAYQPDGDREIKQTIKNLIPGVYQVTVHGRARSMTEPQVYATVGESTEKTFFDNDVTKDYSVVTYVNAGDDLTIGAKCTNTATGARWFALDNFRLTYVGEDFPEYTLATGVMNASVDQAQADAETAFLNDKSVETYNALLSAIDAAKASVEMYAANSVALEAQKALIDATNVYDAEGFDAYKTAYETALAAYDNLTATEAVVNPNSATGWHASTAYNFLLTPWKLGESACNEFDNALYINTWSTEGDTDGSKFTVPFFEYWVADGQNLAANTISATIDVEENGLYEVEALVRASHNSNDFKAVNLTVNGGTEVNVADGTQIGETNRYMGTFQAEGLVKDGKLVITFDVPAESSISWFCFKNVKYTKVRDLTPEEQIVYATAEEIVAFKASVTAAEANTIGFLADEYAPYNNAAAIAALKAAKALDVENPIDIEVLTPVKEALDNATWTANTEEVNAVYDGTFANATNDGAPAGWTMSNNTLGGAYHSRAFVGDQRLSEFNSTNSGLFLRFDGTNSNRGSMYYYGNAEGYTMPLKANTTYKVSVDFAGWGSTGKPLRLNVTGPEGFTATGVQANTSVKADTEAKDPQNHTIVFTTGPAGNYVINFQTPGADSNTHNVVVSNIVLKLAAIERTTATEKYGTICAPFAAKAEGAKVYSAAVNGTEVELTEVTEMEAGVPYIYQATADAQTFSYAKGAIVAAPVEALPLVGVFAETSVPVGSYVMQTQNGAQKFYIVAEGKQPTLSANKAYLTVPASEAKTLSIGFAEETAIKAIDALMSGDAKIYDLNGREQKSLQKGVNIVNGVKVLVK